jgi:general secretion pathway protein G
VIKQSSRCGFTLIEILVVVVILGVLAAIVVPQFSQSSDDARLVSTVQSLQSLRGQIERYRNQHNGRLPGATCDSSDDTIFRDQLTLPTNEVGATGPLGDPNFPNGPYVHSQLPANPFNHSRRVQNVAMFPATAPGGETTADPGWVFERSTGRFKINKTGKGLDGTDYWNL